MPTIEHRSDSADRTGTLGACLARFLEPGDVVVLSGDLGAGKTRFVQGVAEGLGVTDHVTSPTFGLLAVHPGRLPLVHFDLYRLESAEQLEDVDFWGMLESGGASFVEWGDRFPSALPEDHLEVQLLIEDESERRVVVTPHGSRAGALAAAWLSACARTDAP